MKKITFTLFFAFLSIFSYADLIIPGEIARTFSISNIDSFPNYQFFYTFYEYSYNRGYHRNEGVVKKLEANQLYRADTKFGTTQIFAVALKDSTTKYVCDLPVGGSIIDKSMTMIGISTAFKIIEINDKLVLQCTDTVKVYPDHVETIPTNEEQEVEREKRGFFRFLFSKGGSASLMLLFGSFLSFSTLLVLFRKKRQQKHVSEK